MHYYKLNSKYEGDKESAELMIKFDDKLNSGRAEIVTDALDLCGSLKCAPSANDTDIDEFLSDYELISVAYKDGLLENIEAINAFGYDLNKALKDTQILHFILATKVKEPSDYNDILHMALQWGIN